MDIKEGKVIAAKGAYIGLVKAAANVTVTESNGVLVIPTNASVENIPAAVAEQIGYTVEDNKFVPSEAKEEKSYFVIQDANGLLDFSNGWNSGNASFINKVKFADNVAIDLSTTQWKPIGTWDNPFHGVIEGMGCSISGFGATVDLDQTYSANYFTKGQTTNVTGYAFGLIGIAGNGDVEIKDINFVNVNINLTSGNMVSAVIGFAPSNGKFQEHAKWANHATVGKDDVTIENVTVSGSIIGDQDVAALAGKLYNEGAQTVKNCTNDATILANTTSSGRAGGLVSMAAYSPELLIDNCTNKKSVQAYMYAGGILGYASGCTGTISNCKGEGEVSVLSGSRANPIWVNNDSKTPATITLINNK